MGFRPHLTNRLKTIIQWRSSPQYPAGWFLPLSTAERMSHCKIRLNSQSKGTLWSLICVFCILSPLERMLDVNNLACVSLPKNWSKVRQFIAWHSPWNLPWYNGAQADFEKLARKNCSRESSLLCAQIRSLSFLKDWSYHKNFLVPYAVRFSYRRAFDIGCRSLY